MYVKFYFKCCLQGFLSNVMNVSETQRVYQQNKGQDRMTARTLKGYWTLLSALNGMFCLPNKTME